MRATLFLSLFLSFNAQAGFFDTTSINNAAAPLTAEVASVLATYDDRLAQQLLLARQCSDDLCKLIKSAKAVDSVFDDEGYSMDKTMRAIFEAQTVNPNNAVLLQRWGFYDLLMPVIIFMKNPDHVDVLIEKEFLSKQTVEYLNSL